MGSCAGRVIVEDEIEDRGGLGEVGVGSPSHGVVADFFRCKNSYLLEVVFGMVSKLFSYTLGLDFGAHVGSMLGAFWILFRS